MLGNVKSWQGKKAAAICQHQVNVLPVRGEHDAELLPGEIPSFLHTLFEKWSLLLLPKSNFNYC